MFGIAKAFSSFIAFANWGKMDLIRTSLVLSKIS
jgi:hypothetical protein